MRTIARALFPGRCVLCRDRLPAHSAAVLCPKCAAELREKYRTQEQLSLQGVDGAVAALLYTGKVRDAMQRYKFKHQKSCAVWFAAQLAPVVGTWIDDWKPDCITYVPISFLRFWERGYNQSALVARRLARQFDLPCVPLLRKRGFVKQQSSQSAQTRWENVKEAFALRRDAALTDQRVLLIDDVMTTGATLSACTKLLRTGGAARVFVAVITKTPRA